MSVIERVDKGESVKLGVGIRTIKDWHQNRNFATRETFKIEMTSLPVIAG